MSQSSQIAIMLVLFGGAAVCRLGLLWLVGVNGSKFLTVLMLLPAAILLYRSVIYGILAGSTTFLISELSLAYYSAKNLYEDPQNPGDSLESIVGFNIPRDIAKSIGILAILLPMCGYFSSKQLQGDGSMPEWIYNSTLHWVLGIIGGLYFVWGGIQVLHIRKMMKNS